MEFKWYAVFTQSGKEFQAREAVTRRIASDNYEKVADSVVPTYKETVYRDGKKRQLEKKAHPGYLYVKMQMDKEAHDWVLDTPYITRFVKVDEAKDTMPRPLSEQEVKHTISQSETQADYSPVQIDYEVGQKVLIVDGPFNNFQGSVKAIYPDKRKIQVSVEIFGRETPVEIDFFKVKKN